MISCVARCLLGACSVIGLIAMVARPAPQRCNMMVQTRPGGGPLIVTCQTLGQPCATCEVEGYCTMDESTYGAGWLLLICKCEGDGETATSDCYTAYHFDPGSGLEHLTCHKACCAEPWCEDETAIMLYGQPKDPCRCEDV